MERHRTIRGARYPLEIPRLSEVDNKIHKQAGFRRTVRVLTTRWMHTPCVKFPVTWKLLLLGILIIAILCLKSQNFPALAKLSPSFLNSVPESPSGGIIRKEKIQMGVSGMQIMNDAGYLPKPRSMGYYFESIDSDTYLGAQRLDPNLKRRLTHNKVVMTREEIKAQLHLENSRDYRHGAADPFEEDDCVAQYEWQKTSYPTCNTVHEQDLSDLHAEHRRDVKVRILSNGYWRDVWTVHDYKKRNVVVKTMRYEHDFEERNYDRHRRDAVAMEHLTASRNVIDIFGFCGNSGVFEFAPGGDIEHALWYNNERKWNNMERLLAAYQVAAGIADLHDIDREGQASIAHTDITPGQFVYVDGHYKLNDFNRCRFLRWNKRTNEPCPYYVGNNPGKFRSPEEYAYEGQTEKVDIYSMGNIFYSILTELWPFEELKDEKAHSKIRHGERPPIPEEILSSTEPEHKVLLKAMEMSWVHDPNKRATAGEVATYLKSQLRKLRATRTIVDP